MDVFGSRKEDPLLQDDPLAPDVENSPDDVPPSAVSLSSDSGEMENAPSSPGRADGDLVFDPSSISGDAPAAPSNQLDANAPTRVIVPRHKRRQAIDSPTSTQPWTRAGGSTASN